MFFWLVALFVGVPIIELALLLRVARVISIGPTIGLVVITGVLGAALARRQGLRAWQRVQGDLAQGRMPTAQIVDALLIFVAGVVLVTPGIITDAIGFALLIPSIRDVFKRKVADYLRSRIVITRHGSPDRDVFVDVEPTSAHDGDPRSTLP